MKKPEHDVPPAARWIEKLDRLAASGEYDDAAIVFDYGAMVIFSWQTHRLTNLEWAISKGKLPAGFVAFKWHGVRLDLRVWYSPEGSRGSLFAVETPLSRIYCPENRTDYTINQDWSSESPTQTPTVE